MGYLEEKRSERVFILGEGTPRGKREATRKNLTVPVLDDARPAIRSELHPDTIEKQATTQARESIKPVTVSGHTESRGGQKCPECEKRKQKKREAMKRWRQKKKK
jgi:hypothetical protein